MGSIMNLLIALEAEDITNDVDKEMKKAIGKPSVKSAMNKDDVDDIGETDDILGTKDNKKVNKTKTPSKKEANLDDDEDMNKDKDVAPDEDTTDDLGINNEDNMDDSSEDDITDDVEQDNINPEEEIKNDDELNKKIALRENMILFYNIISSNIKLLSEYTPDKGVNNNTDNLSTISKNMVECKMILFNIITEELESKTYVELLRKYIALNRVYELNIRMLDTYFSELKLISTKNKK